MPIAFRSSGSSVCSRDWLIRENNHHACIRGGSVCTPYAYGAQIVQHGVHVMMSAKCLKRAHEATRGIVRLRIPSIHLLLHTRVQYSFVTARKRGGTQPTFMCHWIDYYSCALWDTIAHTHAHTCTSNGCIALIMSDNCISVIRCHGY